MGQREGDLFAGLGADYVALDVDVPDQTGQGISKERTFRNASAKWSQALADTGRRIVFSHGGTTDADGTRTVVWTRGFNRHNQIWARPA